MEVQYPSYKYTRNAWALPRHCSIKGPIPNQMLLQLCTPLGRSTQVLRNIKIPPPLNSTFNWVWSTKVLGNIRVPPPLNFTFIEDLQQAFNSPTPVKLLHSLKIFNNFNKGLILPPPLNFYIHWRSAITVWWWLWWWFWWWWWWWWCVRDSNRSLCYACRYTTWSKPWCKKKLPFLPRFQHIRRWPPTHAGKSRCSAETLLFGFSWILDGCPVLSWIRLTPASKVLDFLLLPQVFGDLWRSAANADFVTATSKKKLRILWSNFWSNLVFIWGLDSRMHTGLTQTQVI